jgi:hypothetical protein
VWLAWLTRRSESDGATEAAAFVLFWLHLSRGIGKGVFATPNVCVKGEPDGGMPGLGRGKCGHTSDQAW